MEIHGVHHLAIKTLRVADLAHFYRDVLGLEEERRHTDDRGLRAIWLKSGNALVMVERLEPPDIPHDPRHSNEPPTVPHDPNHSNDSSNARNDPNERNKRNELNERDERNERNERAGLHLVAFRIDPMSREAWRRHLDHHGHPVVGETAFTLYVLDPDANRIGLSSWPERSSA